MQIQWIASWPDPEKGGLSIHQQHSKSFLSYLTSKIQSLANHL